MSVKNHLYGGVISVLSVNYHPYDGVISVLSVNNHPSGGLISVLSVNSIGGMVITPWEGCKLTLRTLIAPSEGWLITIPLVE